MNDFHWESGDEITKIIAGKTVIKCSTGDVGMNDYLRIEFSDGTILCFRYDYIYEWEVADKEQKRWI